MREVPDTGRMPAEVDNSVTYRVDASVQKITHTMPRDLARRIDDYWHEHGLPSRSEAIRKLVEQGLGAPVPPPTTSKFNRIRSQIRLLNFLTTILDLKEIDETAASARISAESLMTSQFGPKLEGPTSTPDMTAYMQGRVDALQEVKKMLEGHTSYIRKKGWPI